MTLALCIFPEQCPTTYFQMPNASREMERKSGKRIPLSKLIRSDSPKRWTEKGKRWKTQIHQILKRLPSNLRREVQSLASTACQLASSSQSPGQSTCPFGQGCPGKGCLVNALSGWHVLIIPKSFSNEANSYQLTNLEQAMACRPVMILRHFEVMSW